MSSSAKNTRLIMLLLALVLIIAGIVFGLHSSRQAQKMPNHLLANVKIDGVILPESREVKPFHLTEMNGNAFTKQNLKKHWTLLFFGFTNCGYVCPTTLAALNKMYIDLQAQIPSQLMPQVVMISVDPERDTLDKMKQYVTKFNKHFIGVRGSMQETKQLAAQMNVVFAKVKMPGGNYTVSHSAEIMLLDPEGNLRAFLSYPHKAITMARDYKHILSAMRLVG